MRRNLPRPRRAATSMQYASIVGLIGVVALGAVAALGTGVSGMMVKTANSLSSAGNGVGSGGSSPPPPNQPPSWTTPAGALTAQIRNAAASLTLAATDPEGGAVTYALKAGSSLPGGLSLSGAGAITGSPSAITTAHAFTVVASDAQALTSERNFTLSIVDPPNCKAVRDFVPGGTSTGTYTIDPDGDGALAPFTAYCDQTTDGGGWTMVLNLLHQGGTNPAITVRSTNLPLMGSNTLGTNEGGTQYWGTASNSLMTALSFTDIRHYCRTSLHSRVIHFKTTATDYVSYYKGGPGYPSVPPAFTALSGHSANLPAAANQVVVNNNDYVMISWPYYLAGNYHWAAQGRSGGITYDRWECDDFAGGPAYNTQHQIYVR